MLNLRRSVTKKTQIKVFVWMHFYNQIVTREAKKIDVLDFQG
jgi:hypothetical protein